MKVFVSSVVDGFEEYRAVSKAAIESLGHVLTVIEITHPASPDPPRALCLAEVERSDVLLLLLSGRYGEPQTGCKSPTHEEWDLARTLDKPILVFVQRGVCREQAQQEFIDEVSDWAEGRFRVSFSSPFELFREIVRALRVLEEGLGDGPDENLSDGLPPACRGRIERLRALSPAAADRLVVLLSDPDFRMAGALSRLAENPPGWLAEAGPLAWEAISTFMDAHELQGSGLARQKAIEAGSLRSSLYLIREAVAAADQGDKEEAEVLVARVPPDFPLLPAARARIDDDPEGVEREVITAALHTSEDTSMALDGIVKLVWAYWQLERYDLATEVLREANQRFPGRAWLLLYQAQSTLAMADQRGLQSAGSQDLLKEAAGLAVRSRDHFRLWNGPSYKAVAIATQALLALNEPHQVAELAVLAPDGEAKASESSNPDVRNNLAHAYLMLEQYAEINTELLEGIDVSERAWIRAMKALIAQDDAAAALMRRAVALSNDDASRRRALFGLAATGEVGEGAIAVFSEPDIALLRGVAALARGEVNEAIHILTPSRLDSPALALHLAQAHGKAGQLEEAFDVLNDAAEHFGDVSLRTDAAELLMPLGRFGEAQSMATDILVRNPSRALRHRLRRLLVAIAQQLKDWRSVESYAKALASDFPDDVLATWVVVDALHRQGKSQEAWEYVTFNGLVPHDVQTAHLAVTVCGAAGAPNAAANRLLEIADRYTDSEEVVATALMSLLTSGNNVVLTEDQQTRVSELRDVFLAYYPQSVLLQMHSVAGPEDILEIMAASLRPRFEQLRSLIEQVSYGRLPYGVLQWIRELPYAQLLVSVAAGWLTAVPQDEERRAEEREAARKAMGGRVTVDTSVAALGVGSGLALNRLGRVFQSVSVADELISDARRAVSSVREPVVAVANFDPGLDRLVITEIDEEQRRSLIGQAEAALEILASWQRVPSGHLSPPASLGSEDRFAPWDASIRVAAAEGCALWCDDLALRTIAESEGISTFGTWAIYEVLFLTRQGSWLPSPAEMKMRLLRARIADVPLSLNQMAGIADNTTGPDPATELFLRRPHVWIHRPAELRRWYLERVRAKREGSQGDRIPVLLYQASLGWGTSVHDTFQKVVTSDLLARTLLIVRDPLVTPTILAASRYAASELSPTVRPDPLPDAVRQMLNLLEPAIGSGPASQTVTALFSEADPADRLVVASIVFGSR
ncbi:MAG: DUF4062 domain-containing protein [bacterium]|nr:DUF4062 domain-containing protein [bacterium]